MSSSHKPNNKKETTTKQIATNIFLHQSKMALQNTEDLAHTLYTYTIDVKEISLVEVTLDFTGSENIQIENQDSLVVTAQVKPMSSQTIAVIRAYDTNWKIPCKIKLSKKSPTVEEQKYFIQKDVQQLDKEINKAKQQWRQFPIKQSNKEAIMRQIRRNGTNFVDVSFLPTEHAIFDESKGQGFDRVVHWRRPRDFMKVDLDKGILEPQVFEKSIEPSDILQGELGDCWFLCAVACLAEFPYLIERLFLTKEFNDEGIYMVRMFKNGEWREVCVDDFFPCFPNGTPIFSRGQGNELWVLILEKAYAKLHGSYKNIVGGSPFEAMMDLTGCPTTSFNFAHENVQELIKSGKLWNMIKHFDEENFVMCGGTPGTDIFTESENQPDQKGGLIPGHAYSIIKADEYKGVKLLQIRNPWGNFEWDGDWSDNSPKWTEEFKQYFKPVLEEGDGTFWMEFKDFVANFDSFDVCRTTSWDELRLRGRFIRYNDVSDPQNQVVVSKWLYALEVPAKTHLVIGLHQEDERIDGVLPRRPYIDFGLALLKREPEGSQLIQFNDFITKRDCELECILEPGSYIVVPRTTGCAIRRPIEAEDYREPLIQDNGEPNPLFRSTIQDIFRKFDLVISNSIDYKEFKGFQEILGRKNFTEQDFKNEIINNYTCINNGITIDGFENWFVDQVRVVGEQGIFDMLEKLGYDRDFYSIRSRLFTITFHSRTLEGEGQMEVMIRDAIGTDIDNVTNKLILKEHGKDIERGQGYRIVCMENQDIFSWSYGIINELEHPINAKLDFSESENLAYSTKGPVAQKKIGSQNGEFFMHVQAGFGNFTHQMKHTIEHLTR